MWKKFITHAPEKYDYILPVWNNGRLEFHCMEQFDAITIERDIVTDNEYTRLEIEIETAGMGTPPRMVEHWYERYSGDYDRFEWNWVDGEWKLVDSTLKKGE